MKHNHSCSCPHSQVRFCAHCKVVHCLDCSQEWVLRSVSYNNNYPSYYPWNWTSGYLKGIENQNVKYAAVPAETTLAPSPTCSHKS